MIGVNIKPSDIDKEFGILKKWHNGFQNKVSKYPKRALCIIYILVILLVVVSWLGFKCYKDAQTLKGSLDNDKEVKAENTLNLTFSFYFDRSVENWKINRTYPFELHIKSNEAISTENIVYFKPVYGKDLKPPIAKSYSDSDFSDKHSDTVKGFIDTSSTDEGWYNVCAVIKDKANTSRKIENCDQKVIKVNKDI